MKSFRLFNRQTGSIIALVALVLAVVAPTIASAAQLTARSVELSSSSINATGVNYNVGFTSDGAAGGVVIDFCSNSPLINATCDSPAGFAATGATSAFGTVTVVDANTVKVAGAIAATTAITVDLDGITNPSSVGPLYVRIVTYATSGDLANYTSATSLGAGTVDQGGAAINITNTIGVSAAVLESMTFCVSGAIITADCAAVTAPTLKLGETTGTVIALSASSLSTGDIYTQISTNAVTGAVVSLKSSAIGCGGLIRAGAPSACNIGPAQQLGITAGQALFGVKTEAATSTSGVSTASGAFQAKAGTGYNTGTYALNYNDTDESTGVTSTYGDPFLDTNGAPVNNKNVKLTFGASISNTTPAGLYSVDLGLIATGKF
ncbi:MAG: hypothetical protein JWO54_257 [Candidatus Saccharibacteria bacterium]|nr:hypothetical protein [Candidatus Saccharibacteria bacterium]MDB5180499.1 hypothetical protein [Candidatus Saccharibacteria bacterium]